MKKVQKGFTLVELIVVITILAILGTIAFISLQGYSQDAKNSKVTSDLRTLATAVETGISDGSISLGSLVTNSGTTNKVADTNVFYSGSTVQKTLADADTYDVGDINFAGLKQNGDNFKYQVGQTTQDYVVSVLIENDSDDDTSSKDSYAVYQIAGQIPQADGTNYNAAVTGNFYQAEGSAIGGLIAAPNAGTGMTNNQAIAGGLTF